MNFFVLFPLPVYRGIGWALHFAFWALIGLSLALSFSSLMLSFSTSSPLSTTAGFTTALQAIGLALLAPLLRQGHIQYLRAYISSLEVQLARMDAEGESSGEGMNLTSESPKNCKGLADGNQ